jgi:tetratricopeptide (TPR) repeat protein
MDSAEQHFASDPELMAFFDETRNELFKSPEERIAYLEQELAEDPENAEIVRELFGIYGALDMAAKQEEMGARLLELDPTVETFVQVADIKNEDANYQGAIDLYDQALSLAGEDNTLRRDLEYKIARAYYDMGQLQSARSHARSAVRYDNSFCEGYFLIGDVLAKAVQDSEFEREDRAVYWLAMDYWDRAASAGSDCRTRARQKVQQYAQYMPTKEDKFFKGWNEGDEYTIDYGRYSWVGESTHVR